MYEVSYISPSGQGYQLHSGQMEIVEDGLEKLVGVVKDRAHTAVGMPGQVVESQIFEPIRGSVAVLIESAPALDAETLALEFRQAFHHRKQGQLAVATRWGTARLRVRRDGLIPDPKEVNGKTKTIELRIPVIADDGVWMLGPYSETGIAEVSNNGDTTVYVELQWSGTGGQVTLPSGAQLNLPSSPEPRKVLLNPWDACAVVNDKGSIDHSLWNRIDTIPEGIPPEETATFRLPAGVTAVWQVGILDPWR